MVPAFATPLALIGLASLPALAAIYFLHARSRLYPVSSLLLWSDARVAPDGGRRVDRVRLPLAFWLELLLLTLLAVAAAGPRVPTAAGARPLVVVLDDSYSMRAGGADSARARAKAALRDELDARPRGAVRLVLAGDRPQVLGDASAPAAEVDRLLDGWTCPSAGARLDSAVALALELGGPTAGVLVLTDHPPEAPGPSGGGNQREVPAVGTGRVRWWAFGAAAPNWAIVNAGRTAGPRGDRVLLEVANLAPGARATALRLEAGDPARTLRAAELSLGAGETHRLVLELPEGTGPVRAVVADGELPIDDAVTLMPALRKPVTYDVRVGDRETRAALERALAATGGATPAAVRPHLAFVDGEAGVPDDETTWVVRVLREPEAEAFAGPFVLDRAHPLADGLSLQGVVWGGGKAPLPGAPVVMAGNVQLVTDAETGGGRHELRVRLRPDLSTLTESPAWPALVWNLVAWRATALPGLARANVRVGEEAVWTPGDGSAAVAVTRPDGGTGTVPVHARRAAVRADLPGVYTLRAGGATVAFAANALNRDESDLTACATGRWGEERDDPAGRGFRPLAPWLVLLALGVAAVHVWLLARTPAAGARP